MDNPVPSFTESYGQVIVGIGIDIEEIIRFQKLIKAEKKLFFGKIFSAAEIDYANSKSDPAIHFCAIFTAKEATKKSFSIYVNLNLNSIEVLHDSSTGAPYIQIRETANTPQMRLLKKSNIFLSISHTHSVAVAVVVVTVPENELRNTILERKNEKLFL
ncbi:MAG: holo-ACP synthase [Promethearchaeota archaeon]